MDRLPLVPENEENHDVLPTITELFQDILRTSKYPNNVAENIKKYQIDTEIGNLASSAAAVLRFNEEQKSRAEDINQIEAEMMRILALAKIEKGEILTTRCREEMLKLTRRGIFQKLSDHAIQTYNLIQKSDLYPSRIEQYLDFTFNPSLHTCESCFHVAEVVQTETRKKRRVIKENPTKDVTHPALVLIPDKIAFKNYELHKIYQRKFKLRNIGTNSLVFNYRNFPKDCPFRVQMLSDSCRIAPGMCAEFLLTFKPVHYRDYRESLQFRSAPNVNVILLVSCSRDPPRLLCYIFNPLLPSEAVEKPGPGNKYFSERRCNALNYTIDCGTCLLGSYSIVTLIMQNVGQKGCFLVTTENEWVFNELNNSKARIRELTHGCFSVFPAYFEIDKEGIGEIFVMFLPEKEGVFTEKIFIICDNNCHQEIELLGDCIPFSNIFLKVNEENCNKESDHSSTTPVTLTKDEIRSDKLFDTIYKFADVHICELEVFCVVKIPKMANPEAVEEEIQQQEVDFTELVTDEEDEVPKLYSPKLKLSKRFLNFGVIHKGVQVSKCFAVESLTEEKINWKLIEIRYTNKMTFEICSTSALSRCQGTLKKLGRKHKVAYTIEAKTSTRWVSALALFSSNSCTCKDFVLESVCLVAYEIAEIQISIRTDNLLPVLCPKELIYIGIPSIHTIYLHNSGILIGCFYFMKPRGDEASKIRLKFQPQSGIVLPGATVEVKVELEAVQNGVFEDLHVPCFVGDPERLISLRILCTVASINSRGEDWFPEDNGEWLQDEEVEIKEPETDASIQCLIANNSVSATYPTVKAKPVRVKKSAKIKFYIENLTPIHGNFLVDASNYGPEQTCINHILVKAKTRPPEFFWEKSCQDGYGITIEPERPSGDMVPYEMVEIDLWIYANTWGKYLEEVIVEINDLTPFCFNLIVDVVGSPLEFPFARNTLLDYPTIRFENISYTSNDNERSFTVTNISSVPVNLTWHIFMPDDEAAPFNAIIEINEDTVSLKLSSEYYGTGACPGCVELKPFDFVVEKQSTVTMTVFIKNCDYRPLHWDKTQLKYYLIGFIHLRDEDKFKENYFRRLCGVDIDTAMVNVLVTLELPAMEVDISSDETTIDLFVNDILLNQKRDPQIYLLFRNIDLTPIHFSISIEKPFQILEVRTVPTGITNKHSLVLHAQECLQELIVNPGALVDFEIYKTSKRDDFEVNPSHGQIAGNTGVNKQFADVVIYFTPRNCQLYIESLRIFTNIPQYFIDVTVAGVYTLGRAETL
ncbi:uncharacterized protein BDFB_003375 [Asbolus verrucosus]|uniref:Deleted in lung and esophageal cancer protein 1 n=1 Tax=Asbolus verrucosus TaxID=1661398 RepID=A0A482VYC3_ASBVE|nr:uncharacterized protein BDFB_003375 [Asbolus verrucosus]